ncbi:MAG TPA: hypothetical protein VNC22_01855, partial [Sporichthya sp.]|nr:hypothetical protein [Sporichthya sp.]
GQFIGQGGTFVEQAAKDGPAFFQQMRNYAEPFAVYNDYANTFIETGAKSFDSFADQFGAFIQPGDTSMRQFADSMRDAEVNGQAPCDAQAASVGDKVLDQLAAAFVRGDTKKAIALIQKNNLYTNHEGLAKAIVAAGLAVAESNDYEPFIRSVSESFVDSGISPMDTGQTFGTAAANVASTLTFEQGAIGFRTICETYQRYLEKGKFS